MQKVDYLHLKIDLLFDRGQWFANKSIRCFKLVLIYSNVIKSFLVAKFPTNIKMLQ